jgi:hypothetical protein
VLDDLGLGIAAFLDDEVPVVALDDFFRFEDLVAVDDCEPASIFADALVFRTWELNELGACNAAVV